MREGNFEILVLDEQEKLFSEEKIDTRVFITAKPHTSYHVKINVYRDNSGRFPAKYLRLGLFVDGHDVQYWKRLDLSDEKVLPKDISLPICSVFWGFKKNTSEIRSFIFAAPSTNTATSSSASTSSVESLGSIRLVVFEARVSSGVFQNDTAAAQAPPSTVSLAEGEGRKFWQVASLVTSSGKAVGGEKEKFLPLARWENATATPLHTQTLHYHSADVLRLLRNPNLRLQSKSKRSHEEFGGGEEDGEGQRKKQHVEDEEEGVEEVIREKEVAFLDLSEEAVEVSWKTIKLKK